MRCWKKNLGFILKLVRMILLYKKYKNEILELCHVDEIFESILKVKYWKKREHLAT